LLEPISKIRTEYFGCDDVLKGFGEPSKYGVFLSVRRSLSAHWLARKTTGVSLKWVLLSALVMVVFSSQGTAAYAADQQGVTITAYISGIRNDKGMILAALFCKEKGFPDGYKGCRRSAAKISNRKATIVFKNVPKGVYAVSVIHDENNDRKLETNWIGIPDEGVAVSRNATGTMGPPDYDDAKFNVRGKPILLRIRMLYY